MFDAHNIIEKLKHPPKQPLWIILRFSWNDKYGFVQFKDLYMVPITAEPDKRKRPSMLIFL